MIHIFSLGEAHPWGVTVSSGGKLQKFMDGIFKWDSLPSGEYVCKIK
jgi:hypothetical protein